MQVIVRDNKMVQTTYNFDPSGLAEAVKFYSAEYKCLNIVGYQVKNNNGEVVSYGGSI